MNSRGETCLVPAGVPRWCAWWANFRITNEGKEAQAIDKGAKGLNQRLIVKKEVVKRLYPIAEGLEEAGMESSGGKLIDALWELTRELRGRV